MDVITEHTWKVPGWGKAGLYRFSEIISQSIFLSTAACPLVDYIIKIQIFILQLRMANRRLYLKMNGFSEFLQNGLLHTECCKDTCHFFPLKAMKLSLFCFAIPASHQMSGTFVWPNGRIFDFRWTSRNYSFSIGEFQIILFSFILQVAVRGSVCPLNNGRQRQQRLSPDMKQCWLGLYYDFLNKLQQLK